jgi:DNA-binding NarL/FixJ family response regulator
MSGSVAGFRNSDRGQDFINVYELQTSRAPTHPEPMRAKTAEDFGSRGWAAMHRIILADNQAIFRAGTARVLAMETDLRIVAQVSEGDRLFSSIQSFPSSTVLFSNGLKVNLGELLALLKTCGSKGILIAEKGETISEQDASQLAGIVGRSITAAELTDCVRKVARGQRCVQIDAHITTQAQDAVVARVIDRLTPKEMQIVALIVQGCKNKDIASQLNTKEQVIKNYLRSIYDKTGVSDRLELALFTLHHRLLAEAAARVGSLLEQKAS